MAFSTKSLNAVVPFKRPSDVENLNTELIVVSFVLLFDFSRPQQVPPSNVRLLTFGPKEFHIRAPLTQAVASGPHDNLRQSAMRAPFRGKEFEKAARGSVAGGRDDRGHNRPGGDRVERLRLVRDQSGFRHRSPRLRFLRWFQACAGAHAEIPARRRRHIEIAHSGNRARAFSGLFPAYGCSWDARRRTPLPRRGRGPRFRYRCRSRCRDSSES